MLPLSELRPRTDKQAWIVQDYLALRSAPKVAQKWGISSTRVFEILRLAGIDAAALRRQWDAEAFRERERARAKAKTAAAKARREKIEARLMEKYAPWRDLWAQGVPVIEMAQRLNVTLGYLAWNLDRMRKTRGWFPYRRGPQRAA